MLGRITARELAEWRAFDAIEPFGDYRADLRMGILAASLVNLFKGRRGKPAVPQDYMPFYMPFAARERRSLDHDARGDTDTEAAALSADIRAAFGRRDTGE